VKRVLLEISYDGTNYGGFQIQKNAASIEGTLAEKLTQLTGEAHKIIGGSRTDAGVHARQNIAVFDTDSRIPADKFCLALNRYLPEDIRVINSYEVPPFFHPRKRDTTKVYKYRFYNSKTCPATLRAFYYHVHAPLNYEKMRVAASYFVGTHDFTSFSNIHTPVKDKVRTLSRVAIVDEDTSDPAMKSVLIEGDGFLYNMVRIIAGTLITVGKGGFEPADMKRIFSARDRERAGPTAPAKGLILWEYRFEL